MSRPNVLWIFLDQCRADVLGGYRHPFIQTPNLDRLAQRGVLFEQAFCQNPVCVPSRVSMLSGLYCHQTGVFNNSDRMKPEDNEALVEKNLEKFKEELVGIVTDYGGTIRQLEDDQWVMVVAYLDGSSSMAPVNKVVVKAKKSDLDLYDFGRIDYDELASRMVIEEQ